MSFSFFGAHVSASGGLDKAVERAEAIGANALQLFSASPRVWKKPDLASIKTDIYFSKLKEKSFGPVFTHALYLVNLAADTPEQLKKSQDSIAFELEFDARIQGSGVVVHLGSHKGKGWEAVKDQVATSVDQLLKTTSSESTFLIENSAGQKGKLCSDLSEIRWLLDQIRSPRLGVCIDTCHAHTAGYWLGKPSDQPTGALGHLPTVMTKLDLWQATRCLHVNDSKGLFASGLDRHDNLGDGTIGNQVFQEFFADAQVPSLPLILEVPGIDGESGPDAENIRRLKKLCNA